MRVFHGEARLRAPRQNIKSAGAARCGHANMTASEPRVRAAMAGRAPLPALRTGHALVRISRMAPPVAQSFATCGQAAAPAGRAVLGTVLAHAPQSGLKPGSRVAAWALTADIAGGHAQVSDAHALGVPDTLDAATALALPALWPSAWMALVEYAAVQPGDAVLVHEAATPLGRACLYLAHRLGAAPFALVHDAGQFAACRAAGAREVARYGDPWPALMREHGGADVVLDPGAGTLLEPSVACAARRARLVLIGAAAATAPALLTPAALLPKGLRVLAASWSHARDAAAIRRAASQLMQWALTAPPPWPQTWASPSEPLT